MGSHGSTSKQRTHFTEKVWLWGHIPITQEHLAPQITKQWGAYWRSSYSVEAGVLLVG